MYAVVKTGGKQYRVAVGDKLKVERLQAEDGDKVTLDNVLMIADGDSIEVGTPILNKTVEATVVGNGRGKKLRIVKFRRRQNSRTRTGHRQNFTELEITGIGGRVKKSVIKAKPKAEQKPERGVTSGKQAPVAKKAPATKKAPAGKQATNADDLSKISGVGPVIVGKLVGLGITTFKQIAEFSADEIARVDAELNFKGRIERDNWVEQAQQFLNEEG